MSRQTGHFLKFKDACGTHDPKLEKGKSCGCCDKCATDYKRDRCGEQILRRKSSLSFSSHSTEGKCQKYEEYFYAALCQHLHTHTHTHTHTHKINKSGQKPTHGKYCTKILGPTEKTAMSTHLYLPEYTFIYK